MYKILPCVSVFIIFYVTRVREKWASGFGNGAEGGSSRIVSIIYARSLHLSFDGDRSIIPVNTTIAKNRGYLYFFSLFFKHRSRRNVVKCSESAEKQFHLFQDGADCSLFSFYLIIHYTILLLILYYNILWNISFLRLVISTYIVSLLFATLFCIRDSILMSTILLLKGICATSKGRNSDRGIIIIFFFYI